MASVPPAPPQENALVRKLRTLKERIDRWLLPSLGEEAPAPVQVLESERVRAWGADPVNQEIVTDPNRIFDEYQMKAVEDERRRLARMRAIVPSLEAQTVGAQKEALQALQQ